VLAPEELMQHAIQACRQGIAAGQSPFGCAIASANRLIASCHNIVWQTADITAHAEMTAIRKACRETNEILLRGCVVATTCEPCPMCMAALHWARVDTVYYGATIADARQAGFNELQLPAAELLHRGGSRIRLVADVLTPECRQLFADWQAQGGRSY